MSKLVEFFFSFQENQILGTGVNIAILAFGLLALVELIHEMLRLRKEAAHLDGLSRQLAGRADRAQILEMSRGIPEAYLAARRIRILHDLHYAGADVEPDSLAAIAVAELDRKAPFTRWAASTVVLFGLAGTLLGLTQAVLRAQPMLGDIVDGPAAVQAVIGTFSGLGTAFSTTLMGIFWAVVLGIGLGCFRGNQSKFLQRLEELSLVRLLPYFRTSPALAMVEAAKTLAALENKFGAAMTEIVGQVKTQGLALTKTVEDSLHDVLTESRSTGQSLRASVETSLAGVVREAHERGVALTSTVDRSLAALIDEQRTGITAVLDRLNATQNAMMSLLGEPTADARTLAQNLSVLQQGIVGMHATAEQLVQMTPAIEEAIARQVDRQSRDLHETLHTYIGQLTHNVERQDAIIEDGIIRIGEGFPRFGEVILERLKEQGQILAGSLEAPCREVAAALQSHSQHATALEQGAEKLRIGAALLQERGAQDQEAAREMRAAVAELGAHVKAISSQLQMLERTLASTAPPTIPLQPIVVPRPTVTVTSSAPERAPADSSPAASSSDDGPSDSTGNGRRDRPIHVESSVVRSASFWDRILGRRK